VCLCFTYHLFSLRKNTLTHQKGDVGFQQEMGLLA
jgi:hypothetical protein